MNHFELPREKLRTYGPEKLTNKELLAIVLRSGLKERDVLALAGGILKKFTAEKLPYVPLQDLLSFSGLGLAKGSEIVACFELGKRLLLQKKYALLLSAQDVWHEMSDIVESKKEHFISFYLDSRNQEIKREIISIGILNANLVHPREVFEQAVKCSAYQIIVAHNHPSDDLTPSDPDIAITQRLIKAGEILGIELLDHVIVSKRGFLSFKEKKIVFT